MVRQPFFTLITGFSHAVSLIFQRKMIRFFNGNISIIHPDTHPCEWLQLIDFIRLHGGTVGLVAYQGNRPQARFPVHSPRRSQRLLEGVPSGQKHPHPAQDPHTIKNVLRLLISFPLLFRIRPKSRAIPIIVHLHAQNYAIYSYQPKARKEKGPCQSRSLRLRVRIGAL